MQVGYRVRIRRIELGLTQDELASRIGYSTRSSISNIENGLSSIPASRLNSFAKALNITPNYFTEMDDVKSDNNLDDDEVRIVHLNTTRDLDEEELNEVQEFAKKFLTKNKSKM